MYLRQGDLQMSDSGGLPLRFVSAAPLKTRDEKAAADGGCVDQVGHLCRRGDVPLPIRRAQAVRGPQRAAGPLTGPSAAVAALVLSLPLSLALPRSLSLTRSLSLSHSLALSLTRSLSHSLSLPAPLRLHRLHCPQTRIRRASNKKKRAMNEVSCVNLCVCV